MAARYDTLFYDSHCPLCAREIRTLRKLQDGYLIFADIHEQQDGSPQVPGHEALLRRLHLMTGSGDWVTGLEATVRAWSHTRYGILFRPLLWPMVLPLASRLYEIWADRRYQRKYACAIGHGEGTP